MVPLPKGDWHGEAVTGGFFPAPTAGHTGPALQKYCVLPRADRVVRPYKEMPCKAGPMCPALHYPPRPLQKTCHCEPVTDVTGVAIRPPTLCLSSRALSSYRITSISNPPCSARYVWGAGRIRFHRPTPCRPFSAARRNLA